jgi:uncharacterized membrane protein SpoIIM required for sporulation
VDVDSFIAKYRQEWNALEAATSRGPRALASMPGPDLADVVQLYLRTSSHLAEARARYHDRSLIEYLNRLVGAAHAAIYGARAPTRRGFAALFGSTYREAIRGTAPFILAAAALLVAVAVAADVWIATSPEARAGLIPPAAQEAIRHATGARRPALGPAPEVSSFILVNNVQVAFYAFALGITLGVGTLWILVQNAALIGVLAGAFQALGSAGPFWTLILPHGLLELTAICIAAGAGLRMGWAVVEPGDRPRVRALAEEAAQAVLVVVGVVPAFVVAAIVEGFLTGSTVPAAVQLGVGALLEACYVAFLFGPPRRKVLGRMRPGRRAGRNLSPPLLPYRRPRALIRR